MMKKKILKITAFLLVFALTFGLLSHIMSFKYYYCIRISKKFYRQEKNTIDVLIVGSSHAYSHFYPSVLWEEYGYSAFVLGVSIQPFWNSYHYLVEALKTQKPKVIILEGYRLAEAKDYTTPYYGIKNTYGLNWSLNKVQAMLTSFEKEDWSDYLYPFNNYHSRYGEINAADFTNDFGCVYYDNYKGDLCSTVVYKELTRPDVNAMSKEPRQLGARTEEYYRKILNFGIENQIPVITYITPYEMPAYEYGYFLTGQKIAEEYGMPFINGNELYDEIGIDFSQDYADQYSHLNRSGAIKSTRYIGKYLSEHYDIPDHRGDEKYESWQINAEQFDRFHIKDGLPQISDPKDYAEKLIEEKNYSVFVAVNQWDIASDKQKQAVRSFFDVLGGCPQTVTDGFYAFKNGELTLEDGQQGAEHLIRRDRTTDIRLRQKEMEFLLAETTPYYCIETNGSEESYAIAQGLTILVYDDLFDRVVEILYWDFFDDSQGFLRENPYIPKN